MSLFSKLFGSQSQPSKSAVDDEFRGARLTPSEIQSDEQLDFGDTTITLPEFVRISVDNIDGLAAEHREAVVQTILDGSQSRSPARDVAKRLQEHHPVDRQTAIEIASLQLGRISAFLARERALDAGLTKFKWRWSGALDENPAHEAREGLILSWDDPVIDGKPLGIFDLPGMASDCKCVAEAVMDWD